MDVRDRVMMSALGVLVLGLALAAWLYWQRSDPNARDSAEMVETASPGAEVVTDAVLAFPGDQAVPVVQAGPRVSTNALAAQLCDVRVPLKTRRKLAFDLAGQSFPEAIEALRIALATAEPYLKAAIAEGLGANPHPEAQRLLVQLANGGEEITARAAIRGLARRDDAASVGTLTQLLYDFSKPESVRSEAALALGKVSQPGGLEALLRASNDLKEDAVAESVLDGLARRPFSETEGFFTRLLDSAEQTGADKVTVLEALAETPGEVAPLLLKYAADPDPEVRAAAVWALNSTETDIAIGPQLAELLAKEDGPEVRKRLYEVLSSRKDYDIDAVLSLVQREAEPSAQIAAYGWLAATARAGNSDAQALFNTTALPTLKNVALTDGSAERRLASVLALRRAETAPAAAALLDIAGQSKDPRVVAAARLVRPR
jgi:HEAT repeat protein